MAERFALKKISKDGVARAVERAEHYRLLNDPEQAESICLDILAVDEDNRRARITTDKLTIQKRPPGCRTAAFYLPGRLWAG